MSYRWAVVGRAFIRSTTEANAGGSPSFRPDCSVDPVPGQPELHRDHVSENKTNKK